MKKEIIIPKKEIKTQRLFIPLTVTEQNQIRKICYDRQVKMTDFIRYAIRQTYGIL